MKEGIIHTGIPEYIPGQMVEFSMNVSPPVSVPHTTDPKEFIAKLEPGDIINTRTMHKLRDYKKPRIWSRMISIMQQDYFPHTACYLGNGKVFNMIPSGVHIVPVGRFVKRSPLLMLKVKATPAQKKEAVKYLWQVKKMGLHATIIGVAKTVINKGETRLTGARFRSRQRDDNYTPICSNVVAMAYADLNFTTASPKIYVSPTDLSRSLLTKKALIYLPAWMKEE